MPASKARSAEAESRISPIMMMSGSERMAAEIACVNFSLRSSAVEAFVTGSWEPTTGALWTVVNEREVAVIKRDKSVIVPAVRQL